MNSVKQLQRQYIRLVKSAVKDDGILDYQFKQLQQHESEDEPQFMLDLVNRFYADATRYVLKIGSTIEQKVIDAELKETVHRLKGASMSIGARKVAGACITFQECYDKKNHDGCMQCLTKAKEEYDSVQDKLQTLFSLREQILTAGGSIPIVE